jgi:hypothetical protein
MIRDAGFLLEGPDGSQLEDDPLGSLEPFDRPVGYAAMAALSANRRSGHT